jgi:hypothetical protein
MLVIQTTIVLKQGKKPVSLTIATTTGSVTTTTSTIKGGTRDPTSRSTTKKEVIIPTPSIISLPLKILSPAKPKLMKVNKRLVANEKVLENLNSTIESFTSAMKIN